ncbi:DUF3231 family protein [Litchfieldia salsa]|uniref:DUF3231 family protein n=1 Tax=Litchfieldia salsa TaxID=930152 RepID=A0A1H0U8Y4_9BACI|nr:DUF3231 family protein [Litchfieldia salsa]SDP62601.1 Protein of unknown function [Litchfieldia salsa]
MKEKIDLTATEMAYMWSSYQWDSMNIALLTYFQETVEDEQIQQVVDMTLEGSRKHHQKLEEILKSDQVPLPIGFSDKDVHLNAKKMYTDEFILYFIWFIGRGNLTFCSQALNTVARKDISKYYDECAAGGLKLVNHTRDLLLDKGLWLRSPYIPVPKEQEMVQKQSFLNGWFGDKRPLLGMEIGHLFFNIITNSIGLSLITSFVQVTKTEEIKKYLIRGKEISGKHIEVFSDVLKEEQLPVPSSWNFGVTDSEEAPFSEKLMLSIITLLNSQGINNYGMGLATSMRRDVGLHFTRLTAEVLQYAEDGTNLMIDHGWMEQPPKAPVRD